ncbi:MAG TPA: transposase [Myxococcales bacterium]|nr:transposase [Myxococcales bacterium]
MARQMALKLPEWGGKRKGAGRPPTRPHPGLVGPGVPHLRRADFEARHPVHVTMRMRPGVGYLRSYQRAKIVEDALRAARDRFGVRIVHYSIQGNHLHLIVEAESLTALSRGMQGLAIRLARRLNALSGRSGGVFADRFHARPLKTPREARNAVRYVLTNYRHHALEHLPAGWTDPLASGRFTALPPAEDAPVVAPSVWLLRVGWRL